MSQAPPTGSPANSFTLLSPSEHEIFDGSPLGLVETDLDRNVVYANPAAMAMFGVSHYRGLKLGDVFVDRDARDELDTQMAQRRKGIVGNYQVLLKRLSDEEQVQVDITGIPLRDPRGEIGGSLGIFRDMGTQLAATAIRTAMRESGRCDVLLPIVASHLKKVIPHHMLIVGRYSSDMHHGTTYFVQDGPNASVERKWWPLTQDQRQWLLSPTTENIHDFDALMKLHPWKSMEQDKFVVELRRAGIKSVLRRGVRQSGTYRASVSLMSRTPDAYTAADQVLLDALPIDEAVLRALEDDDRVVAEHKMELLRQLNRQSSMQAACQLLADKLVTMFDWSHVSVFRVDYPAKLIRLIAWSWGKELKQPAPSSVAVQPIDSGVLGWVVANRKERNVADIETIRSDPGYVEAPHPAKVRSELACPIVYDRDGEVRFIINVDDPRLDAFSQDESDALKDICVEVGALMERVSQVYFLQECFEAASDPVIVTNSRNEVRAANPAAREVLGRQPVGPIKNFFDDPEDFTGLAHGGQAPLTLRRDESDSACGLPVLVSRQDLPEGLGGSVFVLRDVQELRRTVESAFVEKAAYEVAVETKTPLSLVMAQLERMSGRAKPADRDDFDTMLRQLDRVRQAYTRLAMFSPETQEEESPRLPIHLREELQALRAQLSKEDQLRIEISTGGTAPPPIQGDHEQIAIVFESLLSVLLRAAPETENVEVQVAWDDRAVFVRFLGRLPPRDATQAKRSLLHDAYADMRIANPLLRRIMAAHGGALSVQDMSSARKQFTLRFPLGEPS